MSAGAVLWAAGVRAVGAVWLFSALTKAITPGAFAAHLQKLVQLPLRWAAPAAMAAALAEAALAMPLLVEGGPPAAALAALVLLAVFSVVTLGAWRLGRIEECGCYGALLRLSPPVSAAVNLGLIALLGCALAFRDSAATQRFAVAAWTAGAGVLLVAVVLALPRIASPLAVGRPWPVRWLPQVRISPESADRIVAILQPGCRRCEVWAKALWRLSAVPGFPAISVVSAGVWKDGAGPRVAPLPAVRAGVFRLWLMEAEAPMAVVVRGGRIVEVWRQTLPITWVQLLKAKKADRA